MPPIFFYLFIDDLSCALRDTEVGCFINNVCVNHLCYADDMVILAPSPCGLQLLLDTCSEYALNHDLLYNAKKSKCMVFSPKGFIAPNLTFRLSNDTLPCVEKYKYLGVLISSCKSDNLDIQRAVQSQYTHGNRLIRKFSKCSNAVKLCLFKAYCSTFYGMHFWRNFSKKSHQAIKVAYNNSFRHLMGIKRDCRISYQFVHNNVLTFEECRRKLVYSFMSRVDISTNTVIKTIRNSLYYMYVSPLMQTWHKALQV